MSIRKRNEYLDGDESDVELSEGYNSDVNEESRGNIGGRKSKRRRLSEASDEESLDGLEESKDGQAKGSGSLRTADTEGEDFNEHDGEHDLIKDNQDKLGGISAKASTPKQVAKAQKAARRSGVVYISRVPPFMKPQTLKHFLAPHAPKGLGRLFLTPEDHAAHSRRVKSGGNKKKSYTDGWVEFISKKDAKVAVETLNGNIIGGKKGNFYHDDLWSMKYLHGFKWDHLTEQIANENAERAARMREEIRKTRQENKVFVEDVERGKMLEGMEAKKKARRSANDGAFGGASMGRPEKEFKQKAVQKSQKAEESAGAVARLQGMVFG